MNSLILDAGAPAALEPLTCTRPLAAIPIGNRAFRERQEEQLAAAGLRCAVPVAGTACLFLAGDAWVPAPDLRRLLGTGHAATLTDADGRPLAWIGSDPSIPPTDQPQQRAGDDAFRVRYPWDLLRIHEAVVGALDRNEILGDLSGQAVVEGCLTLGPGSRVLPGVFVEGPVIVGGNCRIGPNCHLRGPAAIGNGCRIGQAVEIKNSILMSGATIGHLSYCGDSIVGAGANFGAGTIIANFRHDGRRHRSKVDGRLVDTGRHKFGAIVGDGARTGIHTGIYPGRKLWPGVATRPGAIVRQDLIDGKTVKGGRSHARNG